MTYDYYKNQRLLMCEINLNQLYYKKLHFINCVNRNTIYPFFQKDAHILVGENYLSE